MRSIARGVADTFAWPSSTAWVQRHKSLRPGNAPLQKQVCNIGQQLGMSAVAGGDSRAHHRFVPAVARRVG